MLGPLLTLVAVNALAIMVCETGTASARGATNFLGPAAAVGEAAAGEGAGAGAGAAEPADERAPAADPLGGEDPDELLAGAVAIQSLQ